MSMNSQENRTNLPSIHEADGVHLANAMRNGGHFMSRLADAYIRADLENRRKIRTMWEHEITIEWERWGTTEVQTYQGKW